MSAGFLFGMEMHKFSGGTYCSSILTTENKLRRLFAVVKLNFDSWSIAFLGRLPQPTPEENTSTPINALSTMAARLRKR
jgi:hypothetical protein